MDRTAQQIFAHHAEALMAGDIEAVVSDYADDAVFITSKGVLHGKDGVRKAFGDVLADLPNAEWNVPVQNLRRRRPIHRVVGRRGEDPSHGWRRHLRLRRRRDPGADGALHAAGAVSRRTLEESWR